MSTRRPPAACMPAFLTCSQHAGPVTFCAWPLIGADGVGKTSFANDLVGSLESLERPVICIAIPRGAAGGPGHGLPDPSAASNRCDADGHRLYLRAAGPLASAQAQAQRVVNHRDLDATRVIALRV